MRNDNGRGKKREKSHREKKNWKGHADYVERKRTRNAARPPQRRQFVNGVEIWVRLPQ